MRVYWTLYGKYHCRIQVCSQIGAYTYCHALIDPTLNCMRTFLVAICLDGVFARSTTYFAATFAQLSNLCRRRHGEIVSTCQLTADHHKKYRRAEYFGRSPLCVHGQRTNERLWPYTRPQRRRSAFQEPRYRIASPSQTTGQRCGKLEKRTTEQQHR